MVLTESELHACLLNLFPRPPSSISVLCYLVFQLLNITGKPCFTCAFCKKKIFQLQLIRHVFCKFSFPVHYLGPQENFIARPVSLTCFCKFSFPVTKDHRKILPPSLFSCLFCKFLFPAPKGHRRTLPPSLFYMCCFKFLIPVTQGH